MIVDHASVRTVSHTSGIVHYEYYLPPPLPLYYSIVMSISLATTYADN